MKLLHFLSRAGALLLLWACTLPACAITSDPSVIAFDDGTGNHRIYAFARGDNGTLVVNFWSNVFGPWQWSWVDLGVPYGSTFINDPSAITYKGANGIQYIAVFATNDSGHLVVEHWDGWNWYWDDLSAEYGAAIGFVPIARHPSAITYLDQYGNQQIKVFSVDEQHHLWNSSCDGRCIEAQGSWQGLWQFYQINNTGDAGNHQDDWPTAAHFLDAYGQGWTYLFAEDLDAQNLSTGLIDAFDSSDAYQSGYYYSWLGLGLPSDANWDYILYPTAISEELSSVPQGCATFHVFAVGFHNQRLFDNQGCRDTFFDIYSNSGGSSWVDFGPPPSVDASGRFPSLAAISYIDLIDGQSRLHVFYTGSNGDLFRAFWRAGTYQPPWSDQGRPPDGTPAGEPSIVAFWEGGQRVYSFSRANSGHLVVNFCTSSSACDSPGWWWWWADQGTM